MEQMTPKQIVTELDNYIVGQDKAKRSVAVALRNRYRRSKLSDELRDEITPKNIIMKGPTGVGKTEIARRLAKLVRAPFVKVEATKYTEVGYVGRDVESMIRDLVETSIRLVKEEKYEEVKVKASDLANQKVCDILYIAKKVALAGAEEPANFKSLLLSELKEGKHDGELIEMDVTMAPKNIEIMPGMGADFNLGDMLGGLMPPKRKRRKLTVGEAKKIIIHEECERLIDTDAVNSEGIRRAEQEGIIFIDEIDKIAMGSGKSNGPDVSREGVQRDILPFVEGCNVSTKHGTIRTDFILFIAAGAFHVSKIEDLIPELQGRFPIRVELDNLTRKDFLKILTQPKNAITKQYAELLKVDNINLSFNKDSLEEVARIAELENETNENIGARRLHTILEALLEEISFNAGGDHPLSDVIITKEYVVKALEPTLKKHDLSKYII
ncbi:MAG: ATP-dependent protease ATPase subunit HslU [Firmicutes bacterium]|nr:ATP-dependent protease ATPase subunit HslU [Bacillota bacterium]